MGTGIKPTSPRGREVHKGKEGRDDKGERKQKKINNGREDDRKGTMGEDKMVNEREER